MLMRAEVRPGVSTAELDRKAREIIESHGASPSFLGHQGFPASICASVNEEVVHGIPGLRVLKDGDLFSIDIGAYLEGYHADSALTLPVGTISEEAARLVAVTEASFFRGVEFARAGCRIGDISVAVQTLAEEAGYGSHPRTNGPRYRSRSLGGPTNPELWSSRFGRGSETRDDYRDRTDVDLWRPGHPNPGRWLDDRDGGWWTVGTLRAYSAYYRRGTRVVDPLRSFYGIMRRCGACVRHAHLAVRWSEVTSGQEGCHRGRRQGHGTASECDVPCGAG